MREYIFRGFHPNRSGSKTITVNGRKMRGDWVEGSLIQTRIEYSDGRIEMGCEIRSRFIGVDLERLEGGYEAGGNFDVIPETVGQYLGKDDKNGKQIFEGDIVESEEYQQGDEVGVVVYDSNDCTYWVHSEEYGWWLTLNEIGLEVIGNKWEVE